MSSIVTRQEIDEGSRFGFVHGRIRQFIRDEVLSFHGWVSTEAIDDLDPVIYKLWGISFPHPVNLLTLKHNFDQEIKTDDIIWLWGPHAFALFKAKVLRAGVKDYFSW